MIEKMRFLPLFLWLLSLIRFMGGISPSILDFHTNCDNGTQESWSVIPHQPCEKWFPKKHQQYFPMNSPHAVIMVLVWAFILYTGKQRHKRNKVFFSIFIEI